MKTIPAAIDCETTGFHAGFHEIIQLSVVTFDLSFTPYLHFNTLVKPMHPENISDEALKVNGLSRLDLDNAPSPLQVKSSFSQWHNEALEEKKIYPLGQNYPFDKAFLEIFFGKELYDDKFHYKYRDTCVLAQALKDAEILPESFSTKLTSMVNYFNLKDFKAHDSYEDCKYTILVYKELINLIT